MKLKIAVPSGSLQEKTLELLKKAGFKISNGSRSYSPVIDDNEIELLIIKPQEIPVFVQKGVFDLGITGKDWVAETNSKVKIISEMDYGRQRNGKVKWVLAVPNNSKIKEVKDLEGKTIATELVKTTKKYFKKRGVNAKIEFSWGSTEAKCPLLVDAIVDLTETGTTLKKNNLRILAVVLESNTVMIANNKTLEDNLKEKKVKELKYLIEAALMGMNKAMLEMNVSNEKLDGLVKVLPCMKAPTISMLYNKKGFVVKVAIDKNKVREVISLAKNNGATDILEYKLEKVVP